jgi:taurine dioxygenase
VSKQLLSITAVSADFGARVRGIDADTRLFPDAVQEILDVWHAFGVIVLSEQQLSKDQLVAFSGTFGIPEQAAPQERELIFGSEPPEIMIVSNVIENGRPIGHLGNKEAYWHTDMCYMASSPNASALYAIEVPPDGGDTYFMNMYAVFDRLPSALKSRIADLTIKHDKSYTAVGELRHGYDPVHDVAASPGAIHPILKVHPVTGRTALYLGRRLNAYVVGLPVSESEQLLEELWSHTRDVDLVWRHKWSVGDLVIWDNRCVMHKRDAFDQSFRRVMWRTQMQPDRCHNPHLLWGGPTDSDRKMFSHQSGGAPYRKPSP